MSCRQLSSTIVNALELPRLVRLEEGLFAASFALMKLLAARFMLDRARDMGRLGPTTLITETTSGTMGLALAMICALRHNPLVLVSDPAIDRQLKERLEQLGARVEIITEPAPVGGYQRARLDRLARVQSENPDHFWPSQYDNAHNPGAYAPVAEIIAETMGEIDCLVGTVGSGGSMCGTSSYLRLLYPHVYVIGVDTPGSVLFGQPDGKRMLRGLGNSLMPRNLDHTHFDEVHWVSAAEAFHMTQYLYKRYALFQGGTSGAAYLVARWWARKNPGAKVVVLLPDEGYRYQETIYSDDWLRAKELWLAHVPAEAKLVHHPEDAGPVWSRFMWKRRTYEDVMQKPFKLL